MAREREGAYWAERRQTLLDQMEGDEAKLKERLSRLYAAETAKLEKEIAAYYQRYGEDDVIQYRKLLLTLPDSERALLIERMDEFGRKYPQYAHLLPVRESIYRLNELEGLRMSMLMQQLEIGAVEVGEVQAHLERQALRSANLAAEQMGFGTSFYTVDAAVITATVGAAWASERSFSESIWGNRQKLASYLSEDFAKAVARGETYERCAQELSKRFENVSKRDINRLIFTEGTFVFNEAHAQASEQAFERYTVSTCRDGRVCAHCRGMQEQTEKEPLRFSDRKPGVNFPPFHPWCRCDHEIYVADWDAWIEQRVAKGGGDSFQLSTKAKTNANVYRMEQNESLVKISKKRNSLSVSPAVNTKAFRDAFEALPVPKRVAQSAYEQAGRILRDVDGTGHERLAAIDARTGKVLADSFSRMPLEGKSWLTDDEVAAIRSHRNGVVLIHNHPRSTEPSYADLMAASRNGEVKMSVIVGHDSSVWYVSVDGTEVADRLESYYNSLKDIFGDYAEVKAVDALLAHNEKHRLFEWRRLR